MNGVDGQDAICAGGGARKGGAGTWRGSRAIFNYPPMLSTFEIKKWINKEEKQDETRLFLNRQLGIEGSHNQIATAALSSRINIGSDLIKYTTDERARERKKKSWSNFLHRQTVYWQNKMACVHANLITLSERHTGSAAHKVKLHRNKTSKKAKSVASDRCSAAATRAQTAARGGRDKTARQTKRKSDKWEVEAEWESSRRSRHFCLS